jgi:ferredoxin
MNSFPIIKTKLHNEHIMAGVLAVLILYHLPGFVADISSIIDLLILITVGLLIDLLASLLRYKRVWCCVSGAVTAAIISLLTYGVPMWGRIIGVAAALIIGKNIWGGTGKNLFNPAMIGLLPVALIFQLPFPFFEPSVLLLPAVILSLVFLYIRPYTGLGFLIGSLLALLINRDLSFEGILAYGILFWACLIITDPVTVTGHPVAGFAVSFLAGICALHYFPVPVAYIASVLAVNIFSKTVDRVIHTNTKLKAKLNLPKIYINDASIDQVIDLTKTLVVSESIPEDRSFDKETVLNRIRDNVVFGMGGAGFTTYKKITSVMDADVNDKYLIINGAECDPGLIHDKWLLRHQYDEINKGVELLKACVPFCDVYLAVKKTTLIKGEKLKLHKLQDSYPVGAERLLIQKVLHRSLNYGEIPATEGILVLNVQTVYAIAQAVLYNRPVDTRYLTVADLKNKTARVVKVRLGMKLRDVIDAVYPGAKSIYAGGGIMQAHQAEDNDYIDKTVNFIATGPFPDYKESPQCSGCGMCIQSCPSGLKVNVIADLVDKGKLKETAAYHVKECISCGSCSYSCLAGRNLAAIVKRAKEAQKS